jgi:uncharacterized protein
VRNLALLIAAALLAATAAEPPIPAPQGFVTDTTSTVSAPARERMTRLIQELQQKTGSEIAVLVVDTTEPLDDFTYAMKVADTWKVGRSGDDDGVVIVLALKDRKLRIVTGYGVEGILPDGLIGEIEDRYMVPSLRQGDVGGALWGGVSEIARRIATERGVTLTGMPERRGRARGNEVPNWVIIVGLVAFIGLSMLQRRYGGRGPVIFPGGGNGGFHGGFGGGGGGFGGFGGGSFGGGGAGRSW